MILFLLRVRDYSYVNEMGVTEITLRHLTLSFFHSK